MAFSEGGNLLSGVWRSGPKLLVCDRNPAKVNTCMRDMVESMYVKRRLRVGIMQSVERLAN